MSTRASTLSTCAAIIQTTEKFLPLPKVLWKDIIWQYIPFEAQEIDPAYSLFSPSLNLENLESILPKEAHCILKEIYEFVPLYIVPENGTVTTPEVEVFASIIQMVKKKPKELVVCEFACGHGELGTVLLHAGAKHVIFNVNSYKCVYVLEKYLPSLEKDVGAICDIDFGDYCDIADRNPWLNRKVDLIICRNQIHLLNEEKQVKFFETIHSLLKPGGRALITANSIYAVNSLREFEGSDTYSFHTKTCFIQDLSKDLGDTTSIHPIGTNTVVSDASEQNKRHRIYEKNVSTGFKWKANNTEFRLLDAARKIEISSYLTIHKEKVRAIPEGYIDVRPIHTRLYNRSNLKALFEKRGFIPLEVFVVNGKGHLIPRDENPFVQGRQIGVVVLKP